MEKNFSLIAVFALSLITAGCGMVSRPSSGGIQSQTAPAQIGYTTNPALYNVNQAITPNKLSYQGLPIATASISPALPSGLSIDATTGTISGTPTAITASATYTVRLSNSLGSGFVSLQLAVGDTAPTITYGGLTTQTFTVGTGISTITPTLGGGALTSCSVYPTLPTGLSINSSCEISGTPTVAATSAAYYITAANSGGNASIRLTLAVNDIPPVFSYPASPYTLYRSSAITPIVATSTGGVITQCSASPTLPAGLSLSSGCRITGTPTALSGATAYTITATNSGGSTTASVSLEVLDPAPIIVFTGGAQVYTRGTAISALVPLRTGGPITSCVSPSGLPAGLSVSNTDCRITGTPTMVSGIAAYSVQAINSGGSSTTMVSITVNDVAPTLSYAGSPYTLPLNTMMSTITPTNVGGTITSCSHSGTLPVGVTLNSDCTLDGTPLATASATTYTITGSNSGGMASTSLSLEVRDLPPDIDYNHTTYDFIYTRGTAITTLTPNNAGGTIVSCTATPALPAGLALSATCDLTGTPIALKTSTAYTITATNTGGTDTSLITITIADTVPSLTFAGNPYTFTVGSAITAITPSNTGGAVTSCSANPVLPGGLSLSSTCGITGTPTTPTAMADYTVTATNTGGSASSTIRITVNDVAPTLSYAGSPFTYVVGSAIATLTPTTGGGAITSCSASPALPTGLNLSSTCVLTGTPTVVAASTAYTITATNSGGSASDSIDITVNAVAPSLTYTASPYIFIRGTMIATITPANTGGAPTSCSNSGTLPTGLTLNPNCTLTGTPTVVTASTAYTITATNSGGSTMSTVTLQVNEPVPSISYTPSSRSFVLRETIGGFSPSNTGGAIDSCAIDIALPSGLSLNPTTCAITGAATIVDSSRVYTITATNTGGNSSATLTLAITNQPQILFYGLTALDGSANGTASGSANIWKVSLDGVDRVNLTANTNGSLDSRYPSFNSAGSSVTYVSQRALNGTTNGTSSVSYNLWKSTAVGTSPTALTSNSVMSLDSDSAPAFSPNGSKIAFVSKTALSGSVDGTPTSSYNLWVMNSDGTVKTPLTQNTAAALDSQSPVFSTDGAWIYFSSLTAANGAWDGSASPSYNLWKVRTDGTGLAALTFETAAARDCTEPAISPDGTYLLYTSLSRVGGTAVSSTNIWQIRTDGTGAVPFTVATSSGFDSRQPRYSPDGTEITFSSKMDVGGFSTGSFNIWKMASDGSSQTALTTATASGLDSGYPSFSPDNQKIVFSSFRDVSAVTAQSRNIWVMNANGTGSPTALTSNTSAGLDCGLSPGNVWSAP